MNKKINKIKNILYIISGLGSIFVMPYLIAYKNPSTIDIIASIIFILLGVALILEGVGFMKKIENKKITFGRQRYEEIP